MLGLACLVAGAVVRIDGVARPLILALDVAATLGPLECRGGLWYRPARGVAAGSTAATEGLRLGIGVDGTVPADTGASDSGGEGGMESGRRESVAERGGVANVGEESVVADVDASETGERGRSASPAKWLETLRWWCCSMLASAMRSFSWVISCSILRSENSSRRRCVSIRNASRSCSPIFSSSSSMTPRSIATLYLDSTSSRDEVWCRACLSKSSLCTSMSRSFSCRVRWASRRVVISFCSVFCALFASVLLCLYFACALGE